MNIGELQYNKEHFSDSNIYNFSAIHVDSFWIDSQKQILNCFPTMQITNIRYLNIDLLKSWFTHKHYFLIILIILFFQKKKLLSALRKKVWHIPFFVLNYSPHGVVSKRS